MPHPPKGVVPPGLIPFTSERARAVALEMHRKRKETIRLALNGASMPADTPNRLPLIRRTIERISVSISNPRTTPKELVALSNALDLLLERERIILGKPKPGTIHRARAPEPEQPPNDLPEPE